jgi:hypothetical protein
MNQSQTIHSKQASDKLFKKIIEEIKILRREINLIFPLEDIEEYKHPKRIKRSYERAIRKYQPSI